MKGGIEIMGSEREPTKQELQAAAASLHALNEGDMEQAKFLSKLLEMTIEDNDKKD
ncbi:hypothetical protein ACFWY9_08385 [Amycolatopsis sp. NPDC059027]|uniref:hypothetical protein n=1 Tax=Amycolatopsis sp. NPDC059027 TaxID=3346709 RepID=UPI00366E6047